MKERWRHDETLLDPTSAFIYVAGRTMKKMFRCSTWFPLLAIAGGAVVAIVVLKLMAGAAFDISFLRDVGTNIPPGAAAAGGAAGGGWWGNNPPPLGSLFVSSPNGDKRHQDPSMDSTIVGTDPRGSRAIYDDIKEVGGQDWFRIINPGSTPGWVPGSDLSSTRPPSLPPGRPLSLADTGLLGAHATPSLVSGSNGWQAGIHPACLFGGTPQC